MTTDYLTEDWKGHTSGCAARIGGLFAGVAAFLLAACSSSSSDNGPPPPPPPPPPPTNTAPMASAGADMTVSATIGVQLDGTASSDADGDVLTYEWSFAVVPSGSTAAFDDETAAQPTFIPDLAGDYRIELVVSDGTTTSSTDEILVTAADNTVTQNIGPGGGRIVSADGIVTLDIPAGALTSDEDVSVTFITDDQRDSYLDTEFDGLEGIEAVYDIGPASLTFTTPAELTARTGDNPVVDATTMAGQTRFVLTSEVSEVELIDELTFGIDADVGETFVTGRMHRSSPVVIFGFARRWLDWEVRGVPNTLLEQEYSDVVATLTSSEMNIESAVLWTEFPGPPFSGPTNAQFALTERSDNVFDVEIEYRCLSQGTTTYESYLNVRLSSTQPPGVPSFLYVGRRAERLQLRATKVVVCNAQPPQAGLRLIPGLFPLPVGLTNPETIQALRLGLLTLGGAASGADDPMLLIAGAEGSALFNQRTGEVPYDTTNPARDPLLGALLAYADNLAGGTAGMLFEQGTGNLTANRRCDYDFSIQAFGTFCFGVNGTGYDASLPIGSTAETPEVLFVTRFDIDWFKLDPMTSVYEFANAYSPNFNDFSGTPFSAAGNASNRSALVITNNAPDYSTISQVDTTGQVTLHDAFFGEDFRKIRCIEALCGISVHDDGTGSGAVRMATWDGDNAPTLVAEPIPVGEGPVGIVPLNMGDGTALWGISGFDGNTISLIHTMMSGEEISTYTAPAPGGCDGPAHVDLYVPPGADPSEAQLVGTCFRSNQYFVTDIVRDPNGPFIWVDPTTTPE
ncbi:MAG: PKD domain-containing protein [Woeseiaceae bacterium]|nr:PKD domain-containing protein [Woeseiaceae bacterium]